MENIKKIISLGTILTILIFIVAVSGCTDQSDYGTQIQNINNQGAQVMKDVDNVSGSLENSTMTENTAIQHLQKDKTTMDNLLSQLQQLKPPSDMQKSYNYLLSAYQDYDNAVGMLLNGTKDVNGNEIQKAADLLNEGTKNLDKSTNTAQ